MSEPWWPLTFEEEIPRVWFVEVDLPTGPATVFDDTGVDHDHDPWGEDNPGGYVVYNAGKYKGGDAHPCDSLLEVRALLLAWAYPEGNQP